jgi:hypothetical protein
MIIFSNPTQSVSYLLFFTEINSLVIRGHLYIHCMSMLYIVSCARSEMTSD